MKSKNTKSTSTSAPRLHKFLPTYNNILIQPYEEADKIGSFFIPDSAKHPLNQGEIIAIGPDVNQDNVRFWVGDIVIFNMHSESRVIVDAEMLFVLSADQILLRADKKAFKKS